MTNTMTIIKTLQAAVLLSCLPLAAVAQSLCFYYNGQQLADNATVTIAAETDDWGELTCETNPAGATAEGLVLTNSSAADITGTATLTIGRNTLEPRRVQWCMGGSCDLIKSTPYNKSYTVGAGKSIQVQFDAADISAPGLLEATITAAALGQAATVKVRMLNSTQQFVRRSVVEEYTGTWCGNCPRGIVGMKRLGEEFADRAVVIAAHGGDGEPMAINAYKDLLSGSFPDCRIDRNGIKTDPYSGSGSKGRFHYGIDADFAAALAAPTEAGLELKAQWNDAKQWDVRLTATTTFGINSADAPYRLAFVLLEDGMTGTTSDWAQVNYFSVASGFEDSKNYADDDMSYWRDAPAKVAGVAYDHVPVNTLGIASGIASSIAAPITADETQTYSNVITTLNVKVIQDKNRLSAAALLINTETGQVVNAAKAAIMPFDTEGIQTAATAESMKDEAVYDLQGRRVTALTKKGLYIRRGRIEKIVK